MTGEEKLKSITINNSEGIVIGNNTHIHKKDLSVRLYLVVICFLIIGSTIILVLILQTNKTKTMSGDFRIAVATYYDIDNSHSKLGEEIAEGVYLYLEKYLNETNPSMIVTVWGPSQTGSIKGKTKEDRANQAENLANKIKADMVVYGTITTDTENKWYVTPEFFISANNFFEAEEIVGQHEMGTPIFLSNDSFNIASRMELGTEMLIRTQIISNISLGLAYYSLNRYSDALGYFQSAENISGWDDNQGKEVIYLLCGNAAGKENDIVSAELYYKKALKLDPDYARPFIGLGSVYYIKALQSYEISSNINDIDARSLDQSYLYYQKAITAKHQPELSDILPKAHFGLGQYYLVKAYSENCDTFLDLAFNEFQYTLSDYNDGNNKRITELAAEAHARIGLIYEWSGSYLKASEEYQQAVNITNNIQRHDLYSNKISFLLKKATQTD